MSKLVKIALVAVMLLMLYLGGLWWHGFAVFVALGSLWEFYRLGGRPIPRLLLGIGGLEAVHRATDRQ